MMITNWFGVFTILLISHTIVAVLAHAQGREGK